MHVDVNPAWTERCPGARRGKFGDSVKNHVVCLAAAGEILADVINDLFSPQRFHQVGIGGAAHPGYTGAEVARGKLHRIRADSPGRAVDQHALAWLDTALFKTAQSGHPAAHCSGGFLIGETGRLQRQRAVLRQAFVLGITAEVHVERRSKDLVADAEARDTAAHGFNIPGQFHPQHRSAWPANAQVQAGEQPLGAWHRETAHARVADRDAGRTHPHQNFVVSGDRLAHPPELKHLRGTISFVHNRFHRLSLIAHAERAIVITTLPFLCPASKYRCAAAACSSGKQRSIIAVSVRASASSLM